MDNYIDYFAVFNFIEIFVWIIVGIGFFIYNKWKKVIPASHALLGCAIFFLFGLSDAVEIRSGAWWRPWWLLLWKTACVIGIVIMYLYFYFASKKDRG